LLFFGTTKTKSDFPAPFVFHQNLKINSRILLKRKETSDDKNDCTEKNIQTGINYWTRNARQM